MSSWDDFLKQAGSGSIPKGTDPSTSINDIERGRVQSSLGNPVVGPPDIYMDDIAGEEEAKFAKWDREANKWGGDPLSLSHSHSSSTSSWGSQDALLPGSISAAGGISYNLHPSKIQQQLSQRGGGRGREREMERNGQPPHQQRNQSNLPHHPMYGPYGQMYGGIHNGGGDSLSEEEIDKMKKEVGDRLKKYKSKMEKMKKKEQRLSNENERLRLMINEVSREKRDASRGNLLRQTLLKDGSSMVNASHTKDKQRRLELRRELLEGIEELDHDEDEDGLDLYKTDEEEQGCWNRTQRRIVRFLSDSLPLSSEVSFIHGRYGSGIAAYFRFFRFLVANTYFFLVIWGYAFVRQWMKYDGSYTSSQSALPYWTYFSAWKGGDFFYVLALLLCVIFLSIVSFYRWIEDDRAVVMGEILEVDRQPQRFATIGFTSWDFAISSEREVEDHKHTISQSIMAVFEEEEIKRRRDSRTRHEVIVLYIRRGVGMTLNLGFVIASWVAIIYVTINQKNISDYFQENSSGVRFFADYAAPMTTALINAILPEITFLITEFEKWDDQATLLKHQMWRLYFGRQFNLFINLVTYYSIAKESSPIDAIQSSFDESVFVCGEDAAGSGLFNLMIIEFMIQKFVYLSIYYSKEMVSSCCGLHLKHEEFRVSEGMINLLYFQSLVWISLPMYPFGSIVSAFLMYTNFKFEIKILTKYRGKPATSWNARDTSTFFSKFYNMTLLMAFASYYFFFTSSWDCETSGGSFLGPFALTRNNRPWNAVSQKTEDLGIDWLYTLLTNPLIYISIASLAVLKYNFKNNVIFSQHRLLSITKQTCAKEIDALNRIIDRQERVISVHTKIQDV